MAAERCPVDFHKANANDSFPLGERIHSAGS